MRKRLYNFKGTLLEYYLKEDDFKSEYGSENLVRFQSGGDGLDIVTVDYGVVDIDYSWYACIYECVCRGKFAHLAPKTEDSWDRCGAIDVMLLDYIIDENRAEYRERRIDMYKTLLKKNLNPEMDEAYRRALRMLEDYKIG